MPAPKDMAMKPDAKSKSFDDVVSELQSLRGNFAQLGQLADEARGNISEDIKNRIKEASGSLEEILTNMRERGWDAAGVMGEYGKTLASEAEQHIRARPLTTLLAAAGVGFVISAILRR